MTTEPILEADNLTKYFNEGRSMMEWLRRTESNPIRAVDGVSFQLPKNASIGIIGESGCGKTTLLRVLMGLYTPTDGDIKLDGKPTSAFNRKDWKEYRRRVQIVFQDPFNSLDPRMTIEQTLKEPLEVHNMDDRDERVRQVLQDVELNPPEKFLSKRPNQLSGGEMQRVSIARALVVEPEVILADEPVSMLDVSTQSAILTLLSKLMEDSGVSIVYISHDLSTVSYICDVINVMYLGRIIEQSPTKELINNPKHPYTKELINAIPIPDPEHNRERTTMDGAPREPKGLDGGCRFRDRCPEKMPICETAPDFIHLDDTDVSEERYVACHLYYDHEAKYPKEYDHEAESEPIEVADNE